MPSASPTITIDKVTVDLPNNPKVHIIDVSNMLNIRDEKIDVDYGFGIFYDDTKGCTVILNYNHYLEIDVDNVVASEMISDLSIDVEDKTLKLVIDTENLSYVLRIEILYNVLTEFENYRDTRRLRLNYHSV